MELTPAYTVQELDKERAEKVHKHIKKKPVKNKDHHVTIAAFQLPKRQQETLHKIFQ